MSSISGLSSGKIDPKTYEFIFEVLANERVKDAEFLNVSDEAMIYNSILNLTLAYLSFLINRSQTQLSSPTIVDTVKVLSKAFNKENASFPRISEIMENFIKNENLKEQLE